MARNITFDGESFSFPDDATDTEIASVLNEYFAAPVKEQKESGDFLRGVSTSFKQLPQLGAGLIAGAGAVGENVFGEGGVSTAVKNYGIDKYKAAEADIQKDAKQSDSLSYSWDQAKEGNFGALVDWMQYGLGYGGGQAIQALASGGIGALVGKATLKGTVESLAAGMVDKSAKEIAAAQLGKTATEEAIAKFAAQEAVQKAAITATASKIGQAVGVGAQAYGMEGGEIFGDLVSSTDGKVDGDALAKAFGATVAAGSLEFVGDKLGIDVMLGKSKMFKPAAEMTGIGGKAARAGVALPGVMTAEGGTEYFQTGLEEFGKGKEENILPWQQSESAQRQAFDAAGLGAVGGGGMAVVGGAISSPTDVLKQPDVDSAVSAMQAAIDSPISIRQSATELDATAEQMDRELANAIDNMDEKNRLIFDLQKQIEAEDASLAGIGSEAQPFTQERTNSRNQQEIDSTEVTPGFEPTPYKTTSTGLINDSELPLIGQEKAATQEPLYVPERPITQSIINLAETIQSIKDPNTKDQALSRLTPSQRSRVESYISSQSKSIDLGVTNQPVGNGQADIMYRQRADQSAQQVAAEDAAQSELAPPQVTTAGTPTQAARERVAALPSPDMQSPTGAYINTPDGMRRQTYDEQNVQREDLGYTTSIPDRRIVTFDRNETGTYSVTGNQVAKENIDTVKDTIRSFGLRVVARKTAGEGVMLEIGKTADQAVVTQAIEAVNAKFSANRKAADVEIAALEGQQSTSVPEAGTNIPETSTTVANEATNVARTLTVGDVNHKFAQSVRSGLGEKLSPTGQVGVVWNIDALPDQTEANSTVDPKTGVGRMSRHTAKAITRIAKMLGRNVVFYEATEDVPEGMYRDGKNLYVNVDSGVDSIRVAGHEFTHSLKTEFPDLYKNIHNVAKSIMQADMRKAVEYRRYYGKNKGAERMAMDDLADEFISDIGGNGWGSDSYWDNMFDEVHRLHEPNEAKSIISRIRDAVVKFIKKLVASTPKSGFALEHKMAGGWSRESLAQIEKMVSDAAARSFINAEKVRAGLEPKYVQGSTVFNNDEHVDDMNAQVLEAPSRVKDGRIRRSIDELVAAAESQSDWKTWYARHEDTLIKIFGGDADLFQKVLSATSQATGVKGNVTLALKAYEQMLSGKEFDGFLPAVIKNLQRIKENEMLRGAKISQYGEANDGNTDAIAVDRHIAMLFFNTKTPSRLQIESAKKRIRIIAERLGWEPRQVQAALWAYNQVRLGTDPSKVQSYDTILEARAEEIAALRAKLGRGEVGSVRVAGGSGKGTPVGQGLDGDIAELEREERRSKVKFSAARSDHKVDPASVPEFKFSDYVGRVLFPTVADRTAAGGEFSGIDSNQIESPIPLQGGPGFPLLSRNFDKGVIWANDGKGVQSQKANLIAKHGRPLMAVTLGQLEMHSSNATAVLAYLRTVEAYISSGKVDVSALDKVTESIRSLKLPKEFRQDELASFPGFDDVKALDDFISSASFPARKGIAEELGKARSEKLGLPSADKLIRKLLDPEYAGARHLDTVLILEPHNEDTFVKLGEDDTDIHLSYAFGIKGKVVGKLPVPVNAREIWGDWLQNKYQEKVAEKQMMRKVYEGKATIEDLRDYVKLDDYDGNTKMWRQAQKQLVEQYQKVIKQQSMLDALLSGDYGKLISLDRSFSLAMPAVEITADMAKKLDALMVPGTPSALTAKAAEDFISGNWKTSDLAKNKGGVGAADFSRELRNSFYSATLDLYSEEQLTAMTRGWDWGQVEGKSGKQVNGKVPVNKIRLYQLGDSRIQFALKYGKPFTYGKNVEVFDNDVALVSVVNNNPGVKGIASPAILTKAIEDGATFLDCYAHVSKEYKEGFLPELYAEYGFVEVGRTKFDETYLTEDHKYAWSLDGWKEGDPYPDIVMMRWKGNENERAGFVQRYIEQGTESLPGLPVSERAGSVVRAVAGQSVRPERSESGSSGGDRGDQGNTRPSLASRAYETITKVRNLTPEQRRNLGLPEKPNATGNGSTRESPSRKSYGEARNGAVSAVGVHYSNEQRDTLNSSAYGKGLRGAERQRVASAKDYRLRQRVYFYINNGAGKVTPEAGVGSHAHSVQLNNLYDMDADHLDLMPEGPLLNESMNAFESNVIDAGFDGYMTRNFGQNGAAVLLGEHAVQVTYEGSGSPETEAVGKVSFTGYKADAEAVMANKSLPSGQMKGSDWKRMMSALMPEIDVSHLDDDREYYKDQIVKKTAFSTFRSVDTESPEFKRWFGDSKVVDADGKPLVVYHGTDADFSVFEETFKGNFGSGIYFAGNEDEALAYGEKAVAVYLSIENPWEVNADWDSKLAEEEDFDSPSVDAVLSLPNGRDLLDEAKNGDGMYGSAFRQAVRRLGHDGIIVSYPDGSKEYVAFSPTQIKSAISNTGEFSDTNPDIRYTTKRQPMPKGLKQVVESWIDYHNPFEDEGLYASNVKDYWLVGSRAKGTNKSDSDYDVAVIYPSSVREENEIELSSLKLSERLHSVFGWEMPEYKGNTVDVQIFFDDDKELVGYSKIPLFSARRDWYYSQLEASVDAIPKKITTGNEIALWLSANASKLQVKKDELEWSGVLDYLKMRGKDKVSAAEVNEFLQQNGVKVTETVLGNTRNFKTVEDAIQFVADKEGKTPEWVRDNWGYTSDRDYFDLAAQWDDDREATKFGQYVLPGGENYKELLITLPGKTAYQTPNGAVFTEEDLADPVVRSTAEKIGLSKVTKVDFRSSHFDQPNILAHIRMNERTDADGKRVLFIEEIQSDWGQTYKKYGDKNTDDLATALRQVDKNAPPSAPFVTDTKSWTSLALKRAIAYAVDNGFDSIAWTTGEQQAARYDLSKQIDSVKYQTTMYKELAVTVKDKSGGVIWQSANTNANELEDVVGKELTAKIMDGKEKRGSGTLSGLDLKVGGEGMKGFYDAIVPQVAKKLGAEVGVVSMSHDPNPALDMWEPEDGQGDGSKAPIEQMKQPAFQITDKMREQVQAKGMPLFTPARGAIAGQNIQNSWQAPALEGWDDIVRKLRDKLVDTKRVVQAIRDAGIKIKDTFDPYLQEILYHGRASKRVHDFADNELRPLLQDMQARGLKTKEDMQKFEDYLWAVHAAERNAQVFKVNPKRVDANGNPNGAGLTDQEASSILAGNVVTKNGRTIQIDASKLNAYQSLAKRVQAITNGTLDMLVDYGLETQDTVDAWKATYKNYIPLMRDMESDDNYHGAFNLGTGKGFSVRGSAAKRAMGSDRSVIDILANVAMQRERAIVRGEKNQVAKAVYGLALTAPNTDFWLAINPDAKDPKQIANVLQELIDMGVNPIDAQNIAQEPKQEYIDPKTGLVSYRINPALRSRDDVLAVRVDGKDRFVMFSSDERAQQMVRNLKNLDAEKMGELMSRTATITRYFSSINTQYNPVFGLTNFIRDSGTALLNLSSTPLAGKQREVAGHVLDALRGIYIDLRDHRKGITPTSSWAQEFEEFALEGGQTGYQDMYLTSEDRAKAIAKELANAGKGQKWLAVGEKQSHIFGWLSDYNTAIENAWRVSAYKVAKDSGMSKEQAAALAKNLTVNFNKKGTASVQAGALYAFFNAAVQGTARIGETMMMRNNGKWELTGAGKKILLGSMTLGVMQAVMFAAAGWGDDEPKQFIRERNIIIPLPNGKYFSMPLPLGFHVLVSLGRIPTEFALGGFKNPGKRLTDLFGLVMDAFNPLGSSTVLQTLTPTIVDPLAALAENKDWSGNSIYKEDFNKLKPTAGWTRTKDTASDLSKMMAYGINYMTGGGKYGVGLSSPTPDQIDYLIGQATGGVGRESLKLWQSAKAPMTGEELPMHKIPIVGRFVGETTGQASEMSRFYENLKRIGEHKSTLDEMKDAKDSAARAEYLQENPDARLSHLADKAQREISYLKRKKREAMEKNEVEQVRQLEQRITTKVKLWNDRLKEK